jgi:peptidoglycan/xylan/chitin deacetylase (PgdA/CDA1 family)
MSLDRRTVLKSGLLAAASAALFDLGSLQVQAQPHGGASALGDVSHVPGAKNAVALTFHGAGDDRYAKSILDQAKEAKIGITVMAVGSWVKEKPKWAKQVLADGHDLGNHTMNHLDITQMGLDGATREIQQCSSIIRQVTGQQPKWFRPSQTRASNSTVRRAAGTAGFRHCITYNLDSLDYLDPAVNVVVAAVLNQVKSGDIVSMHLGHAVTTHALGPILHGLLIKKLKPVTITELVSS